MSVRDLTQQRRDDEVPSEALSKSDCQSRLDNSLADERSTVAMMGIGVDPHRSTHTATAVDPRTNQPVASIRIQASLADYARMLR